MPQHALCILTMENVTYSDFMKIMEMIMSLECSPEIQLGTPQIAPYPHVIQLVFEQYASEPHQTMNFIHKALFAYHHLTGPIHRHHETYS